MTELWVSTARGQFKWSYQAKIMLVKFISKNIAILNDRMPVTKLRKCWENVHERMINEGMPKMKIKIIRDVWHHMKTSTIRRKLLQGGKKLKPSGTISLDDLDDVTMDLLEKAEKLYPRNKSSLADRVSMILLFEFR